VPLNRRRTNGHDRAAAPLCTTEHAWKASVTYHQLEVLMLSTIITVLVVLWLLGMVTSTTMGGLLHVLLVLAIIVVLVRIIQGRNPIS
jgi:hypothetical protein